MNPVAEYDHAAVSYSERVVEQYVSVAINKIVYVGVGVAQVVAAEFDKRFAVFALKLRNCVGVMARVVRPAVGEGDCPSGVYGREQFLAQLVAECCA